MKYPLIFEMDDLDLIYVNSPRCACTSTKMMLADLMGVDGSWNNSSIHKTFAGGKLPNVRRYRDINMAKDSYHKFTVVRNPFARVVSFYVGKGDGKIARKWYGIQKGDTFKEFVKKIYELGLEELEEHLIEQYEGFSLMFMDTIVHLENYEKEIEEIKSRYDRDVKTYWRNKSGKGDYRKYYDKETREMVADLYSTDLERLSYEF